MSTVGPLWHAGLLEQAAIAHLREYLPLYQHHIAALNSRPKALPAAQSFAVVTEYDRFPEDKIPAVIVACPGVTGEPVRDGEGFWTATYSVEVSVTATGRNGTEARELAQMQSAAIRGAMLQVSLPDERCDVKAWQDEAFDKIPTQSRRTLVAASNLFAVEVRDIVTDLGEPSAEDYIYPLTDPDKIDIAVSNG